MNKIIALTLIALAGLVSCGKKAEKAEPQAPGEFGITRVIWTSSTTPQDRMNAALAVKETPIELVGGEKATIETNKGKIVLELYSKDAPLHVSNFIRLAECGYYDGLIWHRYVEDFVIQGGSPTNNSVGGTTYTIPFEKNSRKHELGALGAARTPDPNSHNGQFYICLAPLPGLDGEYVVFGKVVEGMDVVQNLRALDTIVKITVAKGK